MAGRVTCPNVGISPLLDLLLTLRLPAGSPPITSAVAINDNGQIVAASGGRTLLLTPN